MRVILMWKKIIRHHSLLMAMSLRALSLAGGNTFISGNCNVDVLFGEYNHGKITVNGAVNCPLIIADDFSMMLKATVITQHIIGTDWKMVAPACNVPVWDVSIDAKNKFMLMRLTGCLI